MKITLVKNNKQHQLCVTTRSVEQLLKRMQKDDSRLTITRFREKLPRTTLLNHPDKVLPTWHRVYPAAEFQKDANGNLVMKQCNGILLLSFDNIESPELLGTVKRNVAFLPSTLCAFVGADGKSVEVLVLFTDVEGNLPMEASAAEELYLLAYQEILPLYQAVIKASGVQIAAMEPSLYNHFLLSLDAHPYYYAHAVPLKVEAHLQKGKDDVPFPKVEGGDEDSTNEGRGQKGSKENIQKMIAFLQEKYDLRYNMVMKYTEYLPKEKGWWGYHVVDARVQKRMTLEVQLAGINVSIKDVRNFLESDFIKNYNPVDEFMDGCYGKWDGKDHIRTLARTVPTNCPYWEDWFYT